MSDFNLDMNYAETIKALEFFDFSQNGIDVNLNELFTYVKPSNETRIKNHQTVNYQAKILASKLISFVSLVLCNSNELARTLKNISKEISKENKQDIGFSSFLETMDSSDFAEFLQDDDAQRLILSKIISEFDSEVREFFENKFFRGFYQKSLVELIDCICGVVLLENCQKLSLGAKQCVVVYKVNQVRMVVNHAIAMEDYLAVKKEKANQ